MKNITFTPLTRQVSLAGFPPISAVKVIPEWYKNISPLTHNDIKLKFPLDSGTHNATMKRCVPFLDAMSIGYVFTLDDDIYIEQKIDENGKVGPFIRWKSDVQIVTWHSPEQFEGFIIPDEYEYMVAKWHNDWKITVPPGYSLLCSHPSNRFDLPFKTITGVVDADTYDIAIQFPFLLKKGFEGVIESGTPVAQLLPFKRDDFSSKVLEFNEDQSYIGLRKFWRTFAGSYKKNYWKKKRYQ